MDVAESNVRRVERPPVLVVRTEALARRTIASETLPGDAVGRLREPYGAGGDWHHAGGEVAGTCRVPHHPAVPTHLVREPTHHA